MFPSSPYLWLQSMNVSRHSQKLQKMFVWKKYKILSRSFFNLWSWIYFSLHVSHKEMCKTTTVKRRKKKDEDWHWRKLVLFTYLRLLNIWLFRFKNLSLLILCQLQLKKGNSWSKMKGRPSKYERKGEALDW